MDDTAGSCQVACFGAFKADLRAGELLKNGRRIRLQEQPFQILAMLLEHPGEVRLTAGRLASAQNQQLSAGPCAGFRRAAAFAVSASRPCRERRHRSNIEVRACKIALADAVPSNE